MKKTLCNRIIVLLLAALTALSLSACKDRKNTELQADIDALREAQFAAEKTPPPVPESVEAVTESVQEVSTQAEEPANASAYVPVANPSGFGLKDRAPYLRHTPLFKVPDPDQLNRFLTDTKSEAVMSFSMGDDPSTVSKACEAMAVGGDSGCEGLIVSAHYCDLTYTGTFLNKFDARKQYDYLVAANGFEQFPLSELSCFGGSRNASAGDVIFWFSNDGEPANASLVTEYGISYIKTVISAGKDLTADFQLNAQNTPELLIKDAKLIKIIYPDSEYQIFAFLVGEMGYSKAAACGVLANIYKESSYRTGGDSVFGICQWTMDRKTDLFSWCASNDLNPNGLYGQLKYMQHELRSDFPSLNNYLASCGDTADDAFNTAKEWCIQFEKPADAFSVGTDRGMLAKETLYPMYGG